MSSNLDFDAIVAYIRDASVTRPPGEYTERRIELAKAVRMAIERFKPGETPAIIGAGVDLYGIDAIRAVRDLEQFPKS
jgi:hypothetical protein